MTTKEITIEKNVYDLDKAGNKQKTELKSGKEVTKFKKQQFKVDCLKFNNGLILIPEYPGKDKENDFASKCAKLTGEYTYLIPKETKEKYSFGFGCGRGAGFAYYISAKSNIEDLTNYLNSIKTVKNWEQTIIKDFPRSELAKQANKGKVKGKAITKVADKGDKIQAEIFASNNQGKIDAIMMLKISDDKKAGLIVGLS